MPSLVSDVSNRAVVKLSIYLTNVSVRPSSTTPSCKTLFAFVCFGRRRVFRAEEFFARDFL